MENLEQKTEKYKLELKDFIPGYGIYTHSKRARPEKFINGFPRAVVLGIYNASLALGTSMLFNYLVGR